VVLTALPQESTWGAGLSDANLASTVLLARVGAIRFLFTGDAEAPERSGSCRATRGALAADVLKVGHHGSRTSTSSRFRWRGATASRRFVERSARTNAFGRSEPRK
jgi:beta-lactamase superfamily II metal-dependent hydrolase